MQLDVLALAAHPDDVELCAGGTICKLTKRGHRVGVVDFTRGELGTRGTPEIRAAEAEEAARVMGLAARVNLGIPDGQIENSRANQLKVIRAVRRFRPHIVLVNAPECRHPDHEAACKLSLAAVYFAGLRKIETEDEGRDQEHWRPSHVLHYMQSVPFEPTLVMDVSDVWECRVKALQAYKSQFWNPENDADGGEPETFISNKSFFNWIEARARNYGYRVGAEYGEPFLYHQGPFGTDDLVDLLKRSRVY